MRKVIFLFSLCCALPAFAERLLIPMDLQQRDHLKAYGVAFWALERGVTGERVRGRSPPPPRSR